MVHFCGGNLSDDDRESLFEKIRDEAYADGYRAALEDSQAKIDALEAEIDALYRQLHDRAWEQKYAGGSHE